MTIKTAVIPVAGLGTRVLPASKAIPKEMLPIVDKPAIQYVVEEAINAGIKKIILVTRSGKEAVENHFDTHVELEDLLAKKQKTALLNSVRNVIPDDVSVVSIRQHKPAGLGHAVLCANSVTNNEPFAVLLPDVLIQNAGEQNDLREMIIRYNNSNATQIMVEPVPAQDVYKYGIVDCGGHALKPGQSRRLQAMVEKPSPEAAPSNLAITGRYILPANIMHLLARTAPGAGDEIQLTDAIQTLSTTQTVEAYHLSGISHDCGNKAGYLLANLRFGLEHPETAEALRAFLNDYEKNT